MRIVFMGTPDFAVPSLEALLRSPHELVGVVTQPDRPKGRGQALTAPPIKVLCERERLSYLQPSKMKDPVFLEQLRAWRPDVIAVAAFGRILPPAILELPPRGCVNVHGSLLPKYRGAAPIQWAVIRGEKETGITTMLMDEGMDTGQILLQDPVAIGPEETAGELATRLAQVGGRLLVETLARLEAGTLAPQPQAHDQATMAPLLKKEDGLLDWRRPARELADQVRGLSPWPGAFTYAGPERWMLRRARPVEDAVHDRMPGTVLEAGPQGIVVAASEGALAITELQPADKRRMSAKEYLAGHPLRPGLVLGGGTEGLRTEKRT